MACCLKAPSHYLNQCWIVISKVLWQFHRKGSRYLSIMMTSSNGNIFHVTGHLCGEFTASDVELWCFFDQHLNKRLSKQWWGWWFEMPSCPLWCHRNDDMSLKMTNIRLQQHLPGACEVINGMLFIVILHKIAGYGLDDVIFLGVTFKKGQMSK